MPRMISLPPTLPYRQSRPLPPKPAIALAGPYLALAVAIGAATAVSAALHGLIPEQSLSMVYLPAVLVCSVLYGRSLGIAGALLSFLTFNVLFIDPRFRFSFEPVSDTLTLAVFLAVALLTGTLAGRVRDQARETAARASTMTVLFNASRALGTSSSREALADILAAEVAHVAHGEVHVFLRSGEAIGWAASATVRGSMVPGADIAALAERAWTQIGGTQPVAGATPSIDRFAIHPLGTIRRPTGLLLCERSESRTSVAEEQTISILCELGTIALERADLMEEMTRTQVLAETDRLRTALLSSISHDFRTPLSGILATVTALIDQGERFSRETAAELLADIRDQAERANRYVANLLDMIKLEAGAIKVKLEPTDVTDIISAAARRCRRRGNPRDWLRAAPTESCLVEADPVLLEQVLHNVLDNALQYSVPAAGGDGGVAISLHASLHIAEIVIADSGPGIPAPDLERVFDKFYRVSGPQGGAQGTGLGLSISRGLIEAMGGTVQARSPVRGDRGTAIHICLKRLHES